MFSTLAQRYSFFYGNYKREKKKREYFHTRVFLIECFYYFCSTFKLVILLW